MANQYQGINFYFGLGGTTVTVTNAVGQFQEAGYTQTKEKVESRNQQGNIVGVTYFNGTGKLNLTWLPSDANTASGSAAISAPTVGTKITITGGNYSGSAWLTDSIATNFTNTGNASITGEFTTYEAIS